MQLTDADIAAFQKLFKEHFGKEISKEEALDRGLRLIRYMTTILKGYAKIEADENTQRNITNQ